MSAWLPAADDERLRDVRGVDEGAPSSGDDVAGGSSGDDVAGGSSGDDVAGGISGSANHPERGIYLEPRFARPS